MNVADRTVRLNDSNAIRFSSREVEIAVANSSIKLQGLHFKSSFIFIAAVIAGSSARQTNMRINIEKDRQFRPIAVANEFRQFFNKVERDPASETLVRHRRIVEAIADHRFTTRQRRNDFLADVLAARRIKQKQFGRCRQMDRFRVEENPADSFSHSCTTRFARDRERELMSGQVHLLIRTHL